MVQSVNQISLYRKMTEKMSEEVGINIELPEITYMENDETKEITVNNDFEGIIKINEYDTMWSPDQHNMRVFQNFTFEKPSVLFGKQGVTMPGNKIGLGVHMHSRTSNFQKTISVGTISNVTSNVNIEFNHVFPTSELRGNLLLDFFLYLKEYDDYCPQHATTVGMILSEDDISNLEIIIDGEGSIFPMSEFSDKNGPLWKIEKNWIEASIDTFDSSNVNLSLNIAHPLFKQIKAGKTTISRAMMGDIMIQAMALIIQQVILIEEPEDFEDALPNSILSAVNYWVSTFEVDISSLFSIINSLKEYWDKKMIEGGNQND